MAALVSIGHALDARIVAVLLRQVDAIGPHSRVVLGLRLHLLHAIDHLVVQIGQVIALLETLYVILGELVGVLERIRMVNVDVRVVIVDHDDSAAVRQLLHILRSVTVCLMLLLLLSHLLLLVDVVLVQGLFGHADLIRANPPVLPTGRLLLSVRRGDVRPLLCGPLVLGHGGVGLADAGGADLHGGGLKRGGVLGHDLGVDLAGGLVLEGDLSSVMAGLEFGLLSTA